MRASKGGRIYPKFTTPLLLGMARTTSDFSTRRFNQAGTPPIQAKEMHVNRKSILIGTLMLAALVFVASVGAAATEESSRSRAPEPPPGVIISGRTKVKSKPKPVRKALEARYAAISEAYRLKDPDAVLRMRTDDFHAVLPSGRVWDAAASAQYTRAGFVQSETTLTLTFEIGTIDVHGDTAAAEIHQHWVRRQQKAGALRLVDTHAHQRETWVRRTNAWLLWRVDHVNPGPWIVDGKQIDPSKPYDPNAPSYEQPPKSR